MNKAIVSMCSKDYEPLADITINQNKALYCELHGYELYVKHIGFSVERTAGYDRMDYVLELMRTTGNGWFWVMGVDTMIMNFQILMEEFIDPKFHFIIAKDCNGVNADSFIVRNSPWATLLLTDILAGRKWHEQNSRWSDSSALNFYCDNPNWSEIIKVVPQKSFNSYDESLYGRSTESPSQYSEGDFLIHWPGLSLERRIELAKEYLPKVILARAL